MRVPYSIAAGVILFASLNVPAQSNDGDPKTADARPTNEFCPVIPDQVSDSQFTTTYEGRTIGFCCADCARRFEADPESYANNLPPTRPIIAPVTVKESWDEYFFRQLQPLAKASGYAANRPWLTAYLVAVIALAALSYRRKPVATRHWSDRFQRTMTRPTILAILILGGLCVQFAVELNSRPPATSPPMQGFESPVGASTHGHSAIAWPQSLHEIPRGLANVYYRGNDERSEMLFNGGRYRTATFHISIRTEDGQELKPGATATQPLFLHCRIVRAPNTARGFFTKDRMAHFRLHRVDATDEKSVPLSLTTLRDEWEWEVRAPIGTANATNYQGLRGVWHLGSNNNQPAHYGIQYVVHSQDGKVLPQSVVWMFAIYQSPILDGPTSDAEWFSDRPIPEIPDGKGVSDPKLLGLSKPAPKK